MNNMNGGGDRLHSNKNNGISITHKHTAAAAAETTGSKKRKRGLAPRKSQAPPTSEVAELAATPKLQNGHHRKPTKREQNVDPVVAVAVADAWLGEEQEVAAVDCCSMCGSSQPHNLVDLSANIVMKRTLTTCWRVPAQNLENTLSAVCVQCIYKITAFKDMKHSLKIRLHRLTNGPSAVEQEETQQSPPTPPSLTLSPTNASTPALQAATAQEPPAAPLLQLAVDTHSQAECSPSPPNLNLSMLKVFCERSESALITESGGKINNYQQSGNSRRLPPPQLTCVHCARVHWRKDYYAKHLRRCAAQHRRPKSVASSPGKHFVPRLDVKVGSRKKAATVAAAAIGADYDKETATKGEKQPPRTRIFHCSECAVTVENITKLREHKRIHLQRYYCSTCGSEFTTMHSYEYHRVVCEAQQLPSSSLAMPRMTRARSRAASQVNALVSGDSESDAETLQRNSDTERDDDDVSRVDTMYSKRMRLTGNWVEDHHSDLSLAETKFFDYDEDQQISTYKEYDLYLLERLKFQIHLNACTCFSCPAVNNICRTKDLSEMMLHDYVDHFKNAFFYCKKCGRCFTSKVFLDYHLDRQNGGRFICFKCGDIFEFQHQLDWHLIRHTKCVNYRCNYCKFEFLTESELLQHCDIEQHEYNGERHLIRIDPAMTVENWDAPTPVVVHRRNGYDVRILNMQLKKTPSIRPLQLSPEFRRRIGYVEFKNQKNPNCWGWK